MSCEHKTTQHLIFVKQCLSCGEILTLPEDDSAGLLFLLERYSDNPPENNKPHQDTAFISNIEGEKS